MRKEILLLIALSLSAQFIYAQSIERTKEIATTTLQVADRPNDGSISHWYVSIEGGIPSGVKTQCCTKTGTIESTTTEVPSNEGTPITSIPGLIFGGKSSMYSVAGGRDEPRLLYQGCCSRIPFFHRHVHVREIVL